MSAGIFTDSFYESNTLGSVHPIRVQPETIALVLGGQANTAPSGTEAVLPSAQVSKSKRSIGINARTVRLKFTAAKTGYKADSVITVPWLDPASFDAIVPKVTTGTYLEVACKVVGVSSEKVN